jgi:hypothetical protein
MKTVNQKIEEMRSKHKPLFVCDRSTSIVIEGYPRSSNTFTVDFIQILSARSALNLKPAHHTHDVDNLLIGLGLGVPCVALIRNPVDAIASYMIYNGDIELEAAVLRYKKFYEPLLPHLDKLVVAEFGKLLSDLNGFVSFLNLAFSIGLPLSADVDADSARAKLNELERGQKIYKPEEFSRKVASPNDERKLMAKEVKVRLAEYFEKHSEVPDLFRRFENSW